MELAIIAGKIIYIHDCTCTCKSLAWLIYMQPIQMNHQRKYFNSCFSIIYIYICTSFWIFKIINIKWVKVCKSSLFFINTMHIQFFHINWIRSIEQLPSYIYSIQCCRCFGCSWIKFRKNVHVHVLAIFFAYAF